MANYFTWFDKVLETTRLGNLLRDGKAPLISAYLRRPFARCAQNSNRMSLTRMLGASERPE